MPEWVTFISVDGIIVYQACGYAISSADDKKEQI